MVDRGTFSVWDYDDEGSHFSVNVTDLTAGNFADINTAMVAMRTAAQALMVSGVLIGKDQLTNVIQDIGHAVPSSPLAQREIKWLVTGIDAGTGNLYGFEMPCADLTLLENHQKYLYKGGAITVAVAGTVTKVNNFKTAFENLAKSPSGAALSLWEIKQVGRNL